MVAMLLIFCAAIYGWSENLAAHEQAYSHNSTQIFEKRTLLPAIIVTETYSVASAPANIDVAASGETLSVKEEERRDVSKMVTAIKQGSALESEALTILIFVIACLLVGCLYIRRFRMLWLLACVLSLTWPGWLVYEAHEKTAFAIQLLHNIS
ncbi:hypothetical protein A374_15933 [Fictibacillus macauensis ZFHKF-1]|uniref:Uncharacterized protein n=1 Tax=Fictibacillus macauensis ZFHKF-1 TaxID=1196324 RepID=I8IXS7_9BACL|nr:hypothetical protein [Fictibacillus macauensis]EIT84291.1 hypothetical protein A374_15933 [Fictibacillus macauensis ZFHKF-1]